MSCHDAKLLLQERLDGRLDPARAADIDRHLATCPTCREEARRLADAWNLLGCDSDSAPGRFWLDGLWMGVRRQKRLYILRLAIPLAAAAGIVLALLAAVRTAAPREADPIDDQVQALPPEDRELLKDLTRPGMWDLAENIEIVRALELLDRGENGLPALEREGETH